MQNKKIIFNKILSLWIGFYLILISFYLLNGEYPYNTFLFRPGERFGDTSRHICFFCKDLTPYYGWIPHDRIYNPILYFIGIFCKFNKLLLPFLFFLSIIFSSLLLFLISSVSFGYLEFKKNIITIQKKIPFEPFVILFVLFTSYPLLFAIDRMNFDLVCFLFFLLYFFLPGNYRFIAFSIFLSFKITYLFFILIMFLRNEKLIKIIGTLFLAFFINYFSLFFFYNDVGDSFYKFIDNLNEYNIYYGMQDYGLFTHSIYNLTSLPFSFCKLKSVYNCESVYFFGNIIYLISLLLGSLSILFFYINRKKIDNKYKVLFTTLCFLLFCNITPSYRLIFILYPLFLFLNNFDCNNFDRKIILLLLILIFPKNISLEFFSFSLPGEVYISYFIDPFIMIIIFVILNFRFIPRYEKILP